MAIRVEALRLTGGIEMAMPKASATLGHRVEALRIAGRAARERRPGGGATHGQKVDALRITLVTARD
jgi:hypothetical protein